MHAVYLSVMAKQLLLVYGLIILGLALTCKATLYTVGGTSGWDVSTDLDTWAKDKQFVVGDVLLFQYSSSSSVNEVTKQSYDGCNTTKVLQSNNGGNTTFPLTKPGDRYFVSGNKLYCLGGMKLHVHVEGDDQAASSPASAPQAESPAGAPQAESGASSLATPSSKSNNPSAVIPSSAMGGIDSLVSAFVGFAITLFWVV